MSWDRATALQLWATEWDSISKKKKKFVCLTHLIWAKSVDSIAEEWDRHYYNHDTHKEFDKNFLTSFLNIDWILVK